MTRARRLLVLALLAAPLVAFYVHRLAKGLGFLDPPWNPEHEQRRTIIAAIYALLLFLCVFLFGYANAWPRVWAVFGVINGLALVVFAALGAVAARRLWKMRHPTPSLPAAGTTEASNEDGVGKPLV